MAFDKIIVTNPNIDQLRSIAKEMVSLGGVKSVILFGSRARGDHKSYSDSDIIIIYSDSSKDPDEESVRIELGISMTFSCDLIAISEEEWEKGKSLALSVFNKAMEEGIVLYGLI